MKGEDLIRKLDDEGFWDEGLCGPCWGPKYVGEESCETCGMRRRAVRLSKLNILRDKLVVSRLPPDPDKRIKKFPKSRVWRNADGVESKIYSYYEVNDWIEELNAFIKDFRAWKQSEGIK